MKVQVNIKAFGYQAGISLFKSTMETSKQCVRSVCSKLKVEEYTLQQSNNKISYLKILRNKDAMTCPRPKIKALEQCPWTLLVCIYR